MKLALLKHKAQELDPKGEMTAAQVAQFLEISGPKMTKLLNSGTLPSRPNPLDARQRLIPCRAVIELLTLPTLAEARETLHVSAQKMTKLLQSGVLPHRKHPLDEHAYTVDTRDVQRLLSKGGARRGSSTRSSP
jgi:hypothetical protein